MHLSKLFWVLLGHAYTCRVVLYDHDERSFLMSTNEPEFDLRYDFSALSKNRLRVYNMLANEIEEPETARSLGIDELEFVAAAGQPSAHNAFAPNMIDPLQQ